MLVVKSEVWVESRKEEAEREESRDASNRELMILRFVLLSTQSSTKIEPVTAAKFVTVQFTFQKPRQPYKMRPKVRFVPSQSVLVFRRVSVRLTKLTLFLHFQPTSSPSKADESGSGSGTSPSGSSSNEKDSSQSSRSGTESPETTRKPPPTPAPPPPQPKAQPKAPTPTPPPAAKPQPTKAKPPTPTPSPTSSSSSTDPSSPVFCFSSSKYARCYAHVYLPPNSKTHHQHHLHLLFRTQRSTVSRSSSSSSTQTTQGQSRTQTTSST